MSDVKPEDVLHASAGLLLMKDQRIASLEARVKELERSLELAGVDYMRAMRRVEKREGELAEAIRLMIDGSPKEFRTFLEKHKPTN